MISPPPPVAVAEPAAVPAPEAIELEVPTPDAVELQTADPLAESIEAPTPEAVADPEADPVAVARDEPIADAVDDADADPAAESIEAPTPEAVADPEAVPVDETGGGTRKKADVPLGRRRMEGYPVDISTYMLATSVEARARFQKKTEPTSAPAADPKYGLANWQLFVNVIDPLN